MSQESYMNYQGMLTGVTTGIVELGGICQDLEMPEQAESLRQMKERLQNHVFSVGIMGEFRRGKSTVINALLGQKIVPSDIVPCSATLNYVRWGTDKDAQIYFKDGHVQTVDVEDLSDYVTKITEESAKMAESVDYAVVHYPCQFCQNGVQIVDTPGLNDDDRMDAIAQDVLPTLDAIIMVLVADSPFSKSEAEFVRNKVMTSDLGRIIFVVNKIDAIDEDDRERLLKDIRKRIQNSVLEKTEAVYGKDSEEYKNTKNKLGEIKLLPISARDALKGKLKNDRSKLEESGYPEFEAMLCKLLTEERGMLELIQPINKVQSAAKEAIASIDMRLQAMNIASEDYEKIQRESMETIQENRRKKKEEIKALKAKGKTLYAELLPSIDSSYGQIEEEIAASVQNIEIAESDMQNEDAIRAFSETISRQIDQEIKDVLSIQTERMMAHIHERLGEDVSALESFGKNLSEDLTAIQTNIALHSSKNGSAVNGKSAGVAAAVEAVTLFAGVNLFDTMIPGVGGIIAGWRENGWKGAVVGGVSGAGLSIGAAALAGAIGFVGMPVAIIAGLAAAFGGKAIVRAIFGRKEKESKSLVSAEDIRRQIGESVNATLANMKNERTLENWLKDTCQKTYEAIADDIDREWENTLTTMEGRLTQIKADLKKNAEDKERMEQELTALSGKISGILTGLQPIEAKVSTSFR